MTWHCASCDTTLTWGAPVTTDPGMQMCPRCGKWMDRAPEEPKP